MSPRARKICIVGGRSVGKSSLTVQYCEEHFVESYYPTIENQYSKSIRFKGQDFEIEILDTSGQDEFSIMNQKHLIGVHGYVLVYSITSRSSFEMIRIINDKILHSTGTESVPMVLVGNKSDLAGNQRQVTEAEGRSLAGEMGCGFVETSARNNENVATCFQVLIQEVEKTTNPVVPDLDKCVVV